MLTHEQLCKAVGAMVIIEKYGNEDKLYELTHQCVMKASLHSERVKLISEKLSHLLDIPIKRMEDVTDEELQSQCQNEVFQAILRYAGELRRTPKGELRIC